ncbi:hypothetical protein L6164_037410 [Bauhinia variegata]|uniref:Uncharacterized protein n=1 Tax=Bauhinia variegata TaxID=167791 RepID=A0ACB9KK09_BAUVA|nr:hypothetical protein L6164_037410 [Bauhinia variegata]
MPQGAAYNRNWRIIALFLCSLLAVGEGVESISRLFSVVTIALNRGQNRRRKAEAHSTYTQKQRWKTFCFRVFLFHTTQQIIKHVLIQFSFTYFIQD